jgi:hypothetical protein
MVKRVYRFAHYIIRDPIHLLHQRSRFLLDHVHLEEQTMTNAIESGRRGWVHSTFFPLIFFAEKDKEQRGRKGSGSYNIDPFLE